MLSIKVKCFNQYTDRDVDKLFNWHEESGRLCEVASDSAYAAGICDTVGEACTERSSFARSTASSSSA